MDCIPRIKQFLWRFAHNSLPLRMNIARRGVEADTRCPVCSRFDEDGGHCFLRCKQVKKCWRELNLEAVRLKLLELHSARGVVEAVLQLKQEERSLIICLLWAWLGSINKANAGEGSFSVGEVTRRATNFANCSYELDSKPV